jgi:hypothetical protein
MTENQPSSAVTSWDPFAELDLLSRRSQSFFLLLRLRAYV